MTGCTAPRAARRVSAILLGALAAFGADKGLLMKPERVRDFTYQGDDWDRDKKAYAPRRDATADEAKRMVAFAKLVDRADDVTFRKEIGSYLDVDGYLRFLATTAFVANTDSFFVLGHNYYLYLHPKTNKLHLIPWDLDRAFANFGNASQNMDLRWQPCRPQRTAGQRPCAGRPPRRCSSSVPKFATLALPMQQKRSRCAAKAQQKRSTLETQ